MELRRRFSAGTFIALATAAQLLAAVFGVSALLTPATASAVQSVPYMINFQGRLTDNNGNVLADGSYNVKFRLWRVASAGTNDCTGAQADCYWEGDRVRGVSDNRITVTNGLFNIQFGDTAKGDPALSAALFNTQSHANLYLEVELPTPATASCATNGCAVFTEGAMTPRQSLAASPYAFNSDALDGLDSSAFSQLATTNSFIDTNTFSKSAGVALALTGTAASTGTIIQFGSVAALSSGSASGTYIGSNPAAFTGDFLNFQVNNVVKLKVDNAGAMTLASGLTIGTGTAITVGASAGQTSTVSCSGSQAVTTAVFTGGVLTTAPGCATITGTGATTTLNNVGSTAIGADLLPGTTNTRSLGSASLIWQNVFTGNIDAASATNTALTIGTAGTTTAVTVGRSGVAVSTPGGVSTSGGNIALGAGNITSTGTIGAGAITGTSLATSGNGTINSGSGTISSTGNISAGTLQIGAASINVGGGTPTLSDVDYLDSAQSITATKTFSKSGGQGIILSGTATSAGAQLQFGSVAALSSGSVNGTYIGSNPAAYTGDFLNFQINSVVKLKVDNSGNVTTPGTLGAGAITGTSLATSGNGTINSGSGTISTTGAINGGTVVATTSVSSPSYLGTGAVSLASGAASSLTLDSVAGNLIMGTNTTAIQKAAATFAIDLATTGTSTLTVKNSNGANVANLTVTGAVSALGGITTSNGTINTGSGSITTTGALSAGGITGTSLGLGSGNITTTGTIGAGTITGTSLSAGSGTISTSGIVSGIGSGLTNLNPTNLAQGSGAVTLQSANTTAITVNPGTTGALNLATQGTGKTIQIGQTTAAVTDVIHIGDSAFAGSVDTLTVGNLLSTSTTTIQGGSTSASAIALTAGTNGGILATTSGTGTIELDSAAGIIAQSTTNSTQAFQVQNAAGASIFNIDTTDTNLITTNPGFEVNPLTGWAGISAGSVARDTTQKYVGLASGKVTAGTTAGGGIFEALTLGLTAQYTLSFYAKLDAASPALTTLQAGYSSTGLTTGEVDCALNSTTVVTAGWNRYVCTFTTPGTNSGSPYVYIQHNDTTSEVLYVDGVQLETGAFASPYGAGQISLNANINSPVNFQENSNSVTAFQITNSLGTNILNVDTLNNNLSNQASNPSLETSATGWAARTGCTTFAQDPTTGYNGTSSLKCINSATANAGMNMTGIVPVMVSGTTYTLSAYVRSSANMTTFEMGRSDTGLIANDTACITAQAVTSLGWKRVSCTFTVGAQSGTPYVYFRQTDAVARTIWVDAVTFETDANASTNYRDGRISLGNATISSPAVFQTNTNSNTAFQIQNAAGIQVFNVDTSSDTDLVLNSGFEVNSVGWSLRGTATNLLRDTSKTYVGIASGKFTGTTGTTNIDGMRYTFPTQLPAVAATAYTISAYVQTSGADTTFTMGYNNGSDTNCTVLPTVSATVPSTTGWTRFTCTTAVNTVVNSIYVASGNGVAAGFAVTLNVDGVRVELGSTATAFGNSNISFNGIFTSPINIRSPNDTTTEFQVQTAGSVNLLSVDSLNKTVVVGSGTSDNTQILLQLDSYEAASNSPADTATCSATANVGAMYYNTESNAIRSCVNSAWEDVVTTAGLGIMLYGVVPDSGNNPGDLAAQQTSAVTGPCRVSWASTTTVTIQPCIAYSGGRKVIVTGDVTRNTMTTQTATVTTGTANAFQHLCLNNATTTQPAFTTASATETANLNGGGAPAAVAFSVGNPIVCLADVKLNAGGTAIAAVYDVRPFTTSSKEFITTAAATPLGVAVIASGGGIALPGGAAAAVRGVVVASNGAVGGTAPNAIIAVSGPVSAKATAGTAANIVQVGAATGYVITATASATAYANMGYTRNTFPITACTTTANAIDCNTSLFLNLNIK